MSDLYSLLNQALLIIQTAGQVVHEIYRHADDYQVTYKSDNSPMTIADQKSHDILVAGLKQLTFFGKPLPILSEEGSDVPFDIRRHWQSYWLIDPLDGTKEFVGKTDEFAINIALVHENVPILGLVYVPCTQTCYFAMNQQGAYIKQFDQAPEALHVRSVQNPVRVALSRHHHQGREKQFENNPDTEIIYCGSAIKICLVAEGKADVYPRLGPTSEWDTAAGHCILIEAGGQIVDLKGNPLRYNLGPSLINPSFLAVSDITQDWCAQLNL
jgi:3'(2'), 5'-bisphosphate nucleotidase